MILFPRSSREIPLIWTFNRVSPASLLRAKRGLVLPMFRHPTALAFGHNFRSPYIHRPWKAHLPRDLASLCRFCGHLPLVRPALGSCQCFVALWDLATRRTERCLRPRFGARDRAKSKPCHPVSSKSIDTLRPAVSRGNKPEALLRHRERESP